MSNDWFDSQTDTSETSRQPVDKRPLYFLIGAVIVLFIAVIALVYSQVISTGRNIATDTSAPASSTQPPSEGATDGSPATTTSDTPSTDPKTDPSVIAAIAQDTTCTTEQSDGPAIIRYASDVIAADLWDTAHKDAITDALGQIDTACEKDYSLYLQDELTDTVSPPQLNSLVADRSWISLERPAPEGAVQLAAFTTPAKNIQCRIENGTLECSIYAYSYPSPDGCEGITATYSVRETGQVASGCSYAIRTDNVQPYGTVVAVDGLVCDLQQDGVTCWSELTGHGFNLKRAADEIF